MIPSDWPSDITCKHHLFCMAVVKSWGYLYRSGQDVLFIPMFSKTKKKNLRNSEQTICKDALKAYSHYSINSCHNTVYTGQTKRCALGLCTYTFTPLPGC